MAANPEMAQAIRESAGRLGIDPSDLATAISYETGGSFDPWKAGPTTQWGQHRGLIQWGEPQAKKYGVTSETSVPDQLKATERYLTDSGVKPGHGLLDIYSAINAGRVGLYDRSDANNGGAPGTVADKVANQMVGHRMKANALLGLPAGPGGAPVSQGAVAGVAPVPSSGGPPPAAAAPSQTGAVPVDPNNAASSDDALLQTLQAMSQPTEQQAPAAPSIPINFPVPPGLQRARALALAMGKASIA